jgi:ADP-heptose:LPS heptosyltransferase
MKDIIGWWFRKSVKRVVARLATVKPAEYPQEISSILVVRDGGFGDIILTIPIINTLRALAGPDVRIDLLIRRQVYQLSQGYYRVNRSYAKGGSLWSSIAAIRSMRRRQYQVVIDLVLSPSLSFALWILGAAPGAHRVGGDKAEMRSMYHQHTDLPPRPSIHLLERLRRIAAPAMGETPLDDRVPWIEWPKGVSARIDSLLGDQIGRGAADTADGAVVLVNLSAGLPKRVWPDDSYRELLRRLADRYNDRVRRWLITASPAEHQRAVSLAAAINHAKITVLPVEQDFRVIAALAGRVDLVVTPDTSILHAASAQGVPLLVFTVAENVISWAPWKVPSAVVSAAKGQPVSTIPVDDVEAAFDRMAEALSASSGTAPQ